MGFHEAEEDRRLSRRTRKGAQPKGGRTQLSPGTEDKSGQRGGLPPDHGTVDDVGNKGRRKWDKIVCP